MLTITQRKRLKKLGLYNFLFSAYILFTKSKVIARQGMIFYVHFIVQLFFCRIIIINLYGRKIKIRNYSTDVGTFIDCLIVNELNYEYGLDPDGVVNILDLGANVGYNSIYLANKFKNATIVSLEIESNNFLVLEYNTAHYPQIMPLKKGIWSATTKLCLSSVNDGYDAFCLSEHPSIQEKGDTIDTISVEDIMICYNRSSIDIMKIDIEGAEMELFAKNIDFLAKTNLIFVETHDRFVPGAEEQVISTAIKYGFKIDKKGQFIVLKR